MNRENTIKLLDQTFNSNFDIVKYTKFIKELFNEIKINQRDCTKYIANEYKEYISSFIQIADYKDSDSKEMEVLVVKLNRTSSKEKARVMQRNFVANWLGKTDKDAALVVFYDDTDDWRFSFVKMEYSLTKDESGKVKPVKELTPAKRYSFLVGINEPNHTCREQFLELVMEEEANPLSQEIEQAFSIDKVTKEFFEKYKELYLDLKEELEKLVKRDEHVKKEFEEKDISIIDFARKLLGQIVFIYFLQKKGWLGVDVNGKWGDGPKDFMRRLFGDKEKGTKPLVPYRNFFNEILEPLFYDALATDRVADDHYYRLFKCKIPFLNGGLFEPINEYNWSGTDIVLDNSIFDKILSTFDRFNFTVKEDEPLEKEVAVDPEMLGKMFENLLEVKDRKSKGAFYTPREIVHYMCRQSLINFFETNTDISRRDIEKFVHMGDVVLDQSIRAQEQKKRRGWTDVNQEKIIPKSIEKNHEKITELLKKIKIVDPACGSGAFLLGMLNEIIKAHSILTTLYSNGDNEIYDIKREIIENCLYGVDIESSAVQICKLRFWLSLIVDESDIKNIRPLPNLDYKIMCGNSLLEEFEGIKLFDEELLTEIKKDYSFEIKQIENEIDKLYKEKGDIARGKSNSKNLKIIEKEIKDLKRKKQKILSGPKEKLRNLTLDEAMQRRIKESRIKLEELKQLQNKFFNEQNRALKIEYKDKINKLEWELIEETLKEQGNEKSMKKLEQYKKNKAKPFFLWKLYFSEIFQRDNPGFDIVIANPPYGFRGVLSSEEKSYFRKERDIKFPTGDIAELFIIISLDNFVREHGTLTFIIPKKSLYGESWRNVRQLWRSNDLTFLMDASKAFEKVLLEQASFSVNKLENKKRKIDVGYLEQKQDKVTVFGKFNIENIFTKDLTNAQIYKGLYSKKLIDKLESGSIEESSEFIKAEIGISNITKDLTFERDDNYPCVKGIDIIKYGLKKQNRYLNGKVAKKFIEAYKDNKIIAQKIIAHVENPYPHIIITIFYDDKERLFSDTGVRIKSLNKKLSEKFLIGYLQSRFCNWFCYNFIYNRAIRTMDFINYYVTQIPIPKDILENELKQKPFIQLVDQILSITKDDDYLDNPDKQVKVKKLEKEIDQLVYNIYELTPEEIEIVEKFGKEK